MKNALPEKNLLEEAATIKRFEYSLFCCDLKKQTNIAEKKISLNKGHRLDKEDEAKKKPTLKNYKESDLVYNNKFSVYKYENINEFKTISFETKNDKLFTFLSKFK